MVDGIESFRDAFKDFSDCYTVIGGAACDILMSEQDVEFRATHDIDMILILEDKKKEFSSVHIDDDTSSLSAILLNDDYYNFMIEGRKVVNDIPVLDAEYLIPFKMYAWLDLTSRKARGEFVKEKDLKKHKYDVFRLMSIIDESATIKLSGLVKEKTAEFLEKIKEEPLSLDSIHAIHTKEDSIEILKAIYLSE